MLLVSGSPSGAKYSPNCRSICRPRSPLILSFTVPAEFTPKSYKNPSRSSLAIFFASLTTSPRVMYSLSLHFLIRTGFISRTGAIGSASHRRFSPRGVSAGRAFFHALSSKSGSDQPGISRRAS